MHDSQLDSLRRDVRWLKLYALVATLALVIPAVKADSAAELNVERINIVDPSGATRMVIANEQRFPLPKLGGKEYLWQ